MAAGMAWDEEDLGDGAAEREAVALLHAGVDAGNPFLVVAGADHHAVGGLLDLEIAAGVVPVVVGAQHVRDAPAAGARHRQHRPRLRRIDDGRRPGGAVMQQVGVVVLEQGNEFDVEGCHWAETLGCQLSAISHHREVVKEDGPSLSTQGPMPISPSDCQAFKWEGYPVNGLLTVES